MLLSSGFALLLAALQGDAYVADGATMVIGNTPVRLAEIDVPDIRTPEGAAARAAMQNILSQGTVLCRAEGERDGQLVFATCTVGGRDLGAQLVSGGHALDCAAVSDGRYRRFEPVGSRDRMTPSARCEP